MTTTFETAKVGDRVWCIKNGWGEIRETECSDRYPIYVCFPNDEFKTYTAGGCYDIDDITQSLFWDEVVIEAPAKPMPVLQIDAKVLVWRHDGEEKKKRYFSHFENGVIRTFNNGWTSWTNKHSHTSGWDNWELAE